MKRLAIILVALSLGGCAGITKLIDVATTPVTITQETVSKVENGLKVVTAGLVAYRRLCIKKVIDPITRNCRGVTQRVQIYTKAAEKSLVELRAAFRANDQATAFTAYNALQKLIDDIQTQRIAAGGI